MPYYQDPNGALHFLSAQDVEDGWESRLPSGCVQITDEVAADIINPPPTLEQTKANRIAEIYLAYGEAIQASVSFTSLDGSAKTYQADNEGENSSQAVLLKAMQGYSLAGAVPEGFYWIAEDNSKVPFTLVDLQGLYAAMLGQGWAAFQKLQDKKTEIRAAETVAAVENINW